MTHAVVVGGGIAGLAAARQLAHAGLDVTLLEQSAHWGGKLAARTVGDVRLDVGAESVLARRPEATDLMDELGLAGQRVAPTTAQPAILVGGRLHRLPPSLQGVPTDPAPPGRAADPSRPRSGRRARPIDPPHHSPETWPSARTWTTASALR